MAWIEEVMICTEAKEGEDCSNRTIIGRIADDMKMTN